MFSVIVCLDYVVLCEMLWQLFGLFVGSVIDVD